MQTTTYEANGLLVDGEHITRFQLCRLKDELDEMIFF